MFRKKNADFRHFGWTRPFPVVESGRNCQKTHLHAKTFHLRPLPCPYEHPLQRNSLEKLMFRKTTVLGSFSHIRLTSDNRIWPKLPKDTSTRKGLLLEPTPASIRPSVTKKQSRKAHVWKPVVLRSFGQIRLISGDRIWSNLPHLHYKGTSTRQDLSFQHIPRSLRPSITKIQCKKESMTDSNPKCIGPQFVGA